MVIKDDIDMYYQVQLHIVCTSLALLAGVGASCTYKGQEVCEGAVVQEMKKSVRICTEGKVLKKKKEEVEPVEMDTKASEDKMRLAPAANSKTNSKTKASELQSPNVNERPRGH